MTIVVIFDADVLIPMILPASRSTHLFHRLHVADHKVAFSPQIYAEVSEKLLTKQSVREWLGLSDEEIRQYLDDLPRYCLQTAGLVVLDGIVPDDPDDDIVMAAAVEAEADYIVSEDKHLRSVGQWHGIKILSRAEFDEELDRLGVPR